METATKTVWNIDPTHSEIQFKVKHLVISTVTGHFRQFEGTVETDGEDFSTAEIAFSADTVSVDTNQEQRDQHLRTAEFFDVEKFPKMTFVSTNVKKVGDDDYIITGDLTIKDTTKSVELKAEHGGYMTDFYGNYKAGFEVTGKINRKDFGLVWGGVTEAGGIVVSDDVKLEFNIQVAKA
ncbi:YceI family protein [Persicitalea jodogahamensis]|uniref:Polyisoprenoid-binding protein n=1 Tax=Persicitalea jodogahamensis TaxID=402147 RepID=A0A8J3D549_9BACT|nr:YceI family protein [Persicitalea jodogahamensis]GHB54538.1 polyisoprenoid-binding protein [Persicitalea jodogahamensis]